MVTPRRTPCTLPDDGQAQMPTSIRDIHTADNRIQHALGLIGSAPGFTLEAIAATLNLSASRLRHLFKAQLDLSPRQYMKRQRLKHAKSLLESSFLTVKEIAARVGANDVSHFVRDYKAFYGETPSATRSGHALLGVRGIRNYRLHKQLVLPFSKGKHHSSTKGKKGQTCFR
jgi:transcriptional regulator GlxA family with amidase domain